MSMLATSFTTDAVAEPGFYMLDQTKQVGPGPYRTIEQVNLYRQPTDLVAYFNGNAWVDVTQ